MGRWAQSVPHFRVLLTPAGPLDSPRHRLDQPETRHNDPSNHPSLLRSRPPGVRPDEQVPWPDRVWPGEPSARRGPASGQWRTGHQYHMAGCTLMSVPTPRQFPDWLTGRAGTKRAIRVSTGSVPKGAHMLSIPLPALSAGPVSRAFFTAGDWV
jgi:hypothetical protein